MTVVLTKFHDLEKELESYPDFYEMAKFTEIQSFGEAYHHYSLGDLTTKLGRLRMELSTFILWLGLVAHEKYKIRAGSTLGFKNYRTMIRYISATEIHGQTQGFYKDAHKLYMEINKN